MFNNWIMLFGRRGGYDEGRCFISLFLSCLRVGGVVSACDAVVLTRLIKGKAGDQSMQTGNNSLTSGRVDYLSFLGLRVYSGN
jgi:hypothetical protein